MIRQVFERGFASVVARFMLDGSAEALFDRIALVGALPPDELAKLRAETRVYLEKVREEGAPYSELAMGTIREVLAILPQLKDAAKGGGASASWGGVSEVLRDLALQAAKSSAESAAAHAQDLAAMLDAKRAAAAVKVPATAAAANATTPEENT